MVRGCVINRDSLDVNTPTPNTASVYLYITNAHLYIPLLAMHLYVANVHLYVASKSTSRSITSGDDELYSRARVIRRIA